MMSRRRHPAGPPIPVHRKEHQRRHEQRADDERVHERRRDEHEAELVQHWRVAQEQLQAQHATSAVSDACPPYRKTLECKTRAGDNTRGFKSTQQPQVHDCLALRTEENAMAMMQPAVVMVVLCFPTARRIDASVL